MPTTYPLIYKMIPTQYVFLVSDDGLLQMSAVSDVPKSMQFKNEQEARAFIENYKEQV